MDASELQFCRYTKQGHVASVTITRPEVRNALHAVGSLELERVWDDFEADDDAWVAVVTGEGDQAFSAGNDLKATAARQRLHPDERPPIKGPRTGFAGLTNRFGMAKPVIARVNGFALGGGFELALACDIIVAAEHARFGLPEVRLGLAALAGGVHRLPRQLPLKVAMGYLLTGRQMTAERAYELGLVNEVVPAALLDEAVARWTDDIVAAAPLSIRATKQAALEGLHLELEQAIEGEYEWELRRRASEDAKEGPRAFAEKRPPVWQGR